MTRKQWLQFFADRMGTWGTVFAQIGVTSVEVANLVEKVETAEGSLAAANKARLESKQATATFYTHADDAHDDGQELINKIRNYAAITNNPAVLTAAMLQPIAPPQPVGAPGEPTQFSATINQDGFVTLSWKSTNAAPSTGAFFQVFRQLNGAGQQVLVGAVPTREFTDTTIPAGTNQVSYRVVGLRGAFTSEPGYYVVRFGVGGGGNFGIVSQGPATGVSGKLAA